MYKSASLAVKSPYPCPEYLIDFALPVEAQALSLPIVGSIGGHQYYRQRLVLFASALASFRTVHKLVKVGFISAVISFQI